MNTYVVSLSMMCLLALSTVIATEKKDQKNQPKPSPLESPKKAESAAPKHESPKKSLSPTQQLMPGQGGTSLLPQSPEKQLGPRYDSREPLP